MQQAGEAARRDLHAEPGPQQANDLCQRHAHLGVQLDDERGQPGTELHRGRAECVGGLEAVSALHAPPTLRAAADLDVEAAHDGAHLGEFFLILRGHAGHFDGPAAVGTRPRRRRRMGLVNPRRAAAASLPPVPCTGPAAWAPAAPLRLVRAKSRLVRAKSSISEAREGFRRFLHSTIQPMARALQSELSAKHETTQPSL